MMHQTTSGPYLALILSTEIVSCHGYVTILTDRWELARNAVRYIRPFSDRQHMSLSLALIFEALQPDTLDSEFVGLTGEDVLASGWFQADWTMCVIIIYSCLRCRMALF